MTEKWISTKDKLPDVGELIFAVIWQADIINDSNELLPVVTIGRLYREDKERTLFGFGMSKECAKIFGFYDVEHVTNWMPITSPGLPDNLERPYIDYHPKKKEE